MARNRELTPSVRRDTRTVKEVSSDLSYGKALLNCVARTQVLAVVRQHDNDGVVGQGHG